MSDSAPTPQPTGSNYVTELPLPHELQEMLGGRYAVEGFLGQGGMGAVYKGMQLQLNRPVAIKILARRGEGDDFAFEQRFKREAHAMATLTHPNIVKVYDCGDAGENYLFMCMELLEGGDLSGAILKGRVTPEVALALIGPICDGLQAAHARGLVHRDIKPANIFLTADGKPKVADFGLAKKMVGKGTLLTKAGMGMGTPDYAAPEQYEGLSDVDHRADIYSVGVMFYQMLTGNLPRGAFRGPSHRVPVDPRLDDAVFKAMEQDRNVRYQSVADLRADVDHILATWMQGDKKMTLVTPEGNPPAPAAATRPPTQVARAQARKMTPKKSGAGMMMGVLGTLAVLAVGVFFMMKKEKKAGPVSAPVDLASPSVAGTSASDSAEKTSVAPAPASAQPPSSSVAAPNASSAPAASTSAAPATTSVPANPAPSTTAVSATTPVPPSVAGPAMNSVPSTAAKPSGPVSRLALSSWRPPPPDLASLLTSSDYEWSTPVNLGPTVNSSGYERDLTLSADGLILVFTSDRVRRNGNTDLYEARRSSVSEPFAAARSIDSVNSSDRLVQPGLNADGVRLVRPSLSADGLILVFNVWTNISANTMGEVWMSTRPDRDSPWSAPVALGPPVSTPGVSDYACLSPDGLTIIVGLDHIVSEEGNDLSRSTRPSLAAPWSALEKLGEEVNTTASETTGSLLADNRTMIFGRGVVHPGAMAGVHTWSMFVTKSDEKGKFGPSAPLVLPFTIATTRVMSVWMSPDCRTMWFAGNAADGGAGVDLWEVKRVPKAGLPLLSWEQWKEALIASDPRLAQYEAGFQARYASDAQKPFGEALASLKQSYVANGIARARAAAQANGNLPEVNLLDAEKTAVENGDDVPDDAAAAPKAIKDLRATYRAAVENLKAKRAKDATPLYDIYEKALGAYVVELAKANKVEEAKLVALLRDEVVKRYIRGYTVESDADVGAKPQAAAVTTPAGNADTWTDTSGRKIQGRFVRLQGDTVTLQLANEREMTVPLRVLSAESQKLARHLSAQASPP